jgi:hypothetical protein
MARAHTFGPVFQDSYLVRRLVTSEARIDSLGTDQQLAHWTGVPAAVSDNLVPIPNEAVSLPEHNCGHLG